MSKNVKKFLQGAVWEWLITNSQLSDHVASLDKKAFFVVPAAAGDPSSVELSRQLIERFSRSKILSTKAVDEYIFRLISDDDEYLLLVCRRDGFPIKIEDDLPFVYETGNAIFLQVMDFITNENVPAPETVPPRLVIDAVSTGDALFEADLKPYLPHVVSWRVPTSNPYHGDSFEVACVRLLLNLNGAGSPVRRFSNLLVQLALVIPERNHDWLFDQLYFTLNSRKPEYLFLGLYQLLEFFFPLKGVAALKSALDYKGSYLQLRAFCSEALGWNINHHTGARAAVHLSSEAFADICLGRALPGGAAADAIEKHKMDAIVKISELRHTLAHQSFAARKVGDDLDVKTEALLSLLIEAFDTYKRRHC